MTRIRKVVLGLAIAAAVTVPVGIAAAADGGAGPHRTPGPGMMTGTMDPGDCPHASRHHEAMGDQGMPMAAMHDQMSAGHMDDGAACGHGPSTRSGT